jgi:hypothetical protein
LVPRWLDEELNPRIEELAGELNETNRRRELENLDQMLRLPTLKERLDALQMPDIPEEPSWWDCLRDPHVFRERNQRRNEAIKLRDLIIQRNLILQSLELRNNTDTRVELIYVENKLYEFLPVINQQPGWASSLVPRQALIPPKLERQVACQKQTNIQTIFRTPHCGICVSDLVEGEQITLLEKCGHVYHTTCFKQLEEKKCIYHL